MSELYYQILLSLANGIGNITGKKLVLACGSAEAVFKEKKRALESIPGVHQAHVKAIEHIKQQQRAEEELKSIEKQKIKTLFFTDKNYSLRLKQCEDGPMLVYYKGNFDLNQKRVISIVGTRNATEYGKEQCIKLVEGLQAYQAMIISGLAYGIDTISHQASVQNNMPTIGILGHGLDKLYPASNRKLTEKMLENGGMLTEFMCNTKPERENFPKRNRIIAGLSDATIVIESANRGGSLITVEYANEYNRDVFAVPGRLTDDFSKGCNHLIKTNKAALIETADDIAYIMGWELLSQQNAQKQRQLLLNLNPVESKIIALLSDKESLDIDGIMQECDFTLSKVAEALLTLEFEGIIKALPGKRYKLLK